MSLTQKRSKCDAVAVATAQFYNTTGTVPSCLQIASDISYLITTQPTTTIVVIDIPDTGTEDDLLGLFCRFGPATKVQKIRDGQVALVEFSEISSPTRLVHMAKINPFYVGHNRVRIEFSSQNVAVNRVQKYNDSFVTKACPEKLATSRVLHLDITHVKYSITVDVIKSIADFHGKVQRIFIGQKTSDNSLEALIEYETVEQAEAAKETLDGADIYSDCCSLGVTFSRLQRILVKENNCETWDFTGTSADQNGLLSSDCKQRILYGTTCVSDSVSQLYYASATTETNMPSMPTPIAAAASQSALMQASSYPGYHPSMGISAYQSYLHSPSLMPIGTSMPSYYGNQLPSTIPGYNILMSNPYGVHAAISYPQHMYPHHLAAPPPGVLNPLAAPPSYQYSQVVKNAIPYTILPTPPPIHHVTTGGIGIGHASSNLTGTTISSRQTDLSIFESNNGVTIMAYPVASSVNCDHFFNLLCVYGNIARIQFPEQLPGNAFIQMGTKEAADLVIKYFNGICIFGMMMHFVHSEKTELEEVDNLGNLPDGSPRMKNYMVDPNNRFRNALVASKSRILEPSRTLHFFNVPLNFTPEEICRVIQDAGAPTPPRIVIFNVKPGQKTALGLLEWDSVTEALTTLTIANHRPIHLTTGTHPFHLKLAFSPKPISDDRAGVTFMSQPTPPSYATAGPGTTSVPACTTGTVVTANAPTVLLRNSPAANHTTTTTMSSSSSVVGGEKFAMTNGVPSSLSDDKSCLQPVAAVIPGVAVDENAGPTSPDRMGRLNGASEASSVESAWWSARQRSRPPATPSKEDSDDNDVARAGSSSPRHLQAPEQQGDFVVTTAAATARLWPDHEPDAKRLRADACEIENGR